MAHLRKGEKEEIRIALVVMIVVTVLLGMVTLTMQGVDAQVDESRPTPTACIDPYHCPGTENDVTITPTPLPTAGPISPVSTPYPGPANVELSRYEKRQDSKVLDAAFVLVGGLLILVLLKILNGDQARRSGW